MEADAHSRAGLRTDCKTPSWGRSLSSSRPGPPLCPLHPERPYPSCSEAAGKSCLHEGVPLPQDWATWGRTRADSGVTQTEDLTMSIGPSLHTCILQEAHKHGNTLLGPLPRPWRRPGVQGAPKIKPRGFPANPLLASNSSGRLVPGGHAEPIQ